MTRTADQSSDRGGERCSTCKGSHWLNASKLIHGEPRPLPCSVCNPDGSKPLIFRAADQSVEAPKVIELSWVQSIGYRVSEPNYCGEGERKKLVELEPLLDLLARMAEALKVKADPRRGASPVVELTQLRHDVLMVTDLLRTHGRLGS